MELRLDDSKSKEDDMGIIGVDVCLMHRDATIKKGPVRKPLLLFALNIKRSTNSYFLFFVEISPEKEQGNILKIQFLLILFKYFILYVCLISSTRGQ